MPGAGSKRRKDDSKDKTVPAAKKARVEEDLAETLQQVKFTRSMVKASTRSKAEQTKDTSLKLKSKNEEKKKERGRDKQRPLTPKEKVAKKVKDEEEELSEDYEDMDEFGDEDVQMYEEDDHEEGGVGLNEEKGKRPGDKKGDIRLKQSGTNKVSKEKNEGKAPFNSSKSHEAHATQKKLARERKQAKPNAQMVTRAKRIWEQIRRKDLAKSEKHKLIQQLCSMTEGHIKELVFKHDASRIVQTAVKNGTEEQRYTMASELKGGYVELAKSPYGRYLLVKLMHYGTVDIKSMIISEFYGNVKSLIRHKEASIVVEDAWSYASQSQKEQLLVEFYGAEFAIFKDKEQKSGSLRTILERAPEKRQIIMKNLFALLKMLVEKDYVIYSMVHRALLEYILNATPGTPEIEQFIELVKEKMEDIAFTKDGAQVVMRCIAYGTAKDRKAFIKYLKPVISQLASHESGYLVLLAMYELIDDTVLVSKSLLPELVPNVVNLATHKTGRISLLYPFAGREPRLLHPPAIKALRELDEIRKTTTKKDPNVRLDELRNNFSPVMIQAITDNAKELSENAFGCKFIVEVLIHGIGNKKAALNAVAETAEGDPEVASHSIHSTWASRMFKSLVQGGPFDSDTKKVIPIDPPLNFHSILYSKIWPEIGTWATKQGSFVVTSLLEAEGFTEKPELVQVLKENIKRIKQAARGGNKGAEIIVSLLEES